MPASQTVTDLPEITLATDDDLIYIVNDPLGTPLSKKITVANFGAGVMPSYQHIKATAQAEGDLHLSDATNWGISKAMIAVIKVVTLSTDWDLYILQNDNGYAVDDANIPMIQVAEEISGNADLFVHLPYEDEDASDEVHLYYLDNSGANAADIYVIGSKLS